MKAAVAFSLLKSDSVSFFLKWKRNLQFHEISSETLNFYEITAWTILVAQRALKCKVTRGNLAKLNPEGRERKNVAKSGHIYQKINTCP